jgi:hypothetical protein
MKDVSSKSFVFILKGIAAFALLPFLLFTPSEGNEIWLGLQGGLSLPNMRGGTTELSRGYSSRQAPFFGLTMDYVLSPSFSIRAEIDYSSQGGVRNGMQPILADQTQGLPIPTGLTLYANFDNETIIDYLEVPLMAEFKTGRRIQFFAGAGPYAGYRVRAKTITSGRSTLYIDSSGIPLVLPGQTSPLPPMSFNSETDVSEEINRLNLGLCGSIGAKIPFGPGLVVPCVRFNLGLSNIQSHPEITGKNHTGAFIIAVGYLYRLK